MGIHDAVMPQSLAANPKGEKILEKMKMPKHKKREEENIKKMPTIMVRINSSIPTMAEALQAFGFLIH